MIRVIDVRVVDSPVEIGANTTFTCRLGLGFVESVRYISRLVAHSSRREIEGLETRVKAHAETLPRAAPGGS